MGGFIAKSNNPAYGKNKRHRKNQKIYKVELAIYELLVISIALAASLENRAKSLFGPLPYMQPIPEPVLEPGRRVRYHRDNGSSYDGIVSRVHFVHHNGKPRYDYYDNRSAKPLDLPLKIESEWPEGGAKPDFMKGHLVYIIPQFGDCFIGIVMTQTSLDAKAEVYVTDQKRSKIYHVTKKALHAMQHPNNSSQSSSGNPHNVQVSHKLTA